MNPIITQHITEACREFQGFAMSTTQGIQVQFPTRKDLVFLVTYVQNYPNVAPHIQAGSRNVDQLFPIIKNWCALYTFTDVIRQIKIYTEIPLPKTFSVNSNDVANAMSKLSAMELADSQKRLNAIYQIPSVKLALKVKEEADKKVKEMNASIRDKEEKINAQNNETKRLLAQQMQLNIQMQQAQQMQPQMQAAAFQEKIKSLMMMSSRAGEEANRILQEFKSNPSNVSDFVKAYKAAKENEIKCRVLADMMKKRGY